MAADRETLEGVPTQAELLALIEEIEAMRAEYGVDVETFRGRPTIKVATGAYL